MISEKINENTPWQDITEGNQIFQAATSREFCTGEWRTSTPVWDQEKCRQCGRNLTMTIARAAAYAPKYAHLERSP